MVSFVMRKYKLYFLLSTWLGSGLEGLCMPIWKKDLNLFPNSEKKRGSCHCGHPGEEDQTGHGWWSSHLQTCVFVLIKHLFSKKITFKTNNLAYNGKTIQMDISYPTSTVEAPQSQSKSVFCYHTCTTELLLPLFLLSS